MTQPTMKVLDDSYLTNDDDFAEGNSDLSPMDLEPVPDSSATDDEGDLTIRQIREEDAGEPTQTQTQTQSPTDLVALLLKSKGIIDSSQILVENEDGTESTRDFNELTPAEQLEILSSDDSQMNYGLEDEEVEAVNYLRENKITLDELIEYHRRTAVEEYQNSGQETAFEIDNYSDEELYVLDLKAKYDDFTNEELEIKLTKALESPDLFKKEIDKIRGEYKTLEEENTTATQTQATQAQEEAFQQITNTLSDIATRTDDMYGIELDDQDKEDVINLIIDRDLNGVTPLVKALDDPDKLFRAAWFIAKGDEAFEILHKYYAKQIEDVRKSSFQKGREDVSQGLSTKPINRITNSSTPRTATPAKKIMHLDDLYNTND